MSGTIQMSGGGLTVSSAEYLGNNGIGTFIQTGGTNNFGSGQLYLGNGSSTGTYNLGGTGLLSGYDEWLGYSGGGTGSFIQSGGTNNLGAYGWLFMGVTGAKGTYSLSALGLLSAEEEYVGDGGSGSFTQSGGSNVSSNYVYVGYFSGSSGTYTLNNGSLSVLNGYNEFLGYDGTGTFTQSGGSNTCGYLSIGNNSDGTGSYSLGGSGYLSVPNNENVGWNGKGAFTQSGGTNTCYGLLLGYTGASGAYTLSGGSLQVTNNMNVGYAGTGTFTQSGGTNSVGNNMYLAYSAGATGSYTLNGGYLSVANNEYVGYSGSATFTQSGGTHVVANESLYLAYESGSVGTYNLSGGYLSAGNLANSYFEEVGYAGSGTFTQSGGTNNCSCNLNLAEGPTGNASYILSGGYLSVFNNENVGYAATGSFTQSGGTNALTSGGWLFIGYNAGAIGTYNLSGSGVLSTSNTDSEYVGYSGTGSFTQSGGSNTCGYLKRRWPRHLQPQRQRHTAVRKTKHRLRSGLHQTGGSTCGYLTWQRPRQRRVRSAGIVVVANNESVAGAGISRSPAAPRLQLLERSGTSARHLRPQKRPGDAVGGSTCSFLNLGNQALSSGTYSLSGGSCSRPTPKTWRTRDGKLHAVRGATPQLSQLGAAAGGLGTYNLSGSGILTVTNNESVGYVERASRSPAGRILAAFSTSATRSSAAARTASAADPCSRPTPKTWRTRDREASRSPAAPTVAAISALPIALAARAPTTSTAGC